MLKSSRLRDNFKKANRKRSNIMKHTEVSSGTIKAAEQRIWVALGGNAEKVATRINTDPEFVANIARLKLMVNGGYEPSSSQSLAREIMGGKNFFGVEKAVKHLGVKPTVRELLCLDKVPFSEEVLESCRDTHVLVAVFPMSILDIRGRKLEKQGLFFSQKWYDKQAFAKDKGFVGWQLVRKKPIAKTWNNLSKDEETPTAQILVYTIVGHFLANGERLFEMSYVLCADLDSDGYRVKVGGGGGSSVLSVFYWYDGGRDNSVGLSAARKL